MARKTKTRDRYITMWLNGQGDKAVRTLRQHGSTRLARLIASAVYPKFDTDAVMAAFEISAALARVARVA